MYELYTSLIFFIPPFSRSLFKILLVMCVGCLLWNFFSICLFRADLHYTWLLVWHHVCIIGCDKWNLRSACAPALSKAGILWAHDSHANPHAHTCTFTYAYALVDAGAGCIRKTCLYIFDTLKPHFYIVKLGFTGVFIIFLINAQNIDCEYSLEPPRRGGSNEYSQFMFWAESWIISEFLIWKFSFFGGKIFSIFE